MSNVTFIFQKSFFSALVKIPGLNFFKYNIIRQNYHTGRILNEFFTVGFVCSVVFSVIKFSF